MGWKDGRSGWSLGRAGGLSLCMEVAHMLNPDAVPGSRPDQCGFAPNYHYPLQTPELIMGQGSKCPIPPEALVVLKGELFRGKSCHPSPAMEGAAVSYCQPEGCLFF